MPRRSLAPLTGLRPWCGLGPSVRHVDVSVDLNAAYFSGAPGTHFTIRWSEADQGDSLSDGPSPHQGHSPVIQPARRRGRATAAHPAAKPYPALSQVCSYLTCREGKANPDPRAPTTKIKNVSTTSQFILTPQLPHMARKWSNFNLAGVTRWLPR